MVTQARLPGLTSPTSAFDLLKREDHDIEDVERILGVEFEQEIAEAISIDARYNGYIKRAMQKAEELKKMEDKQIPDDINYKGLMSISTEAREKLNRIKPLTLGQASRISGIKPTDIQSLMAYIRKNN